MNYGIDAMGMPMAIGNERLIVEAEKIKITDVKFRHGWYDIKNVPSYIEVSDMLLFINSNDIECHASVGRSIYKRLYFLPFVFRKTNGKIQLNIQPKMNFGDLQLSPNVITKVNIDLKICYRLNKIEKHHIPKYGIAIYAENGNCIYTNNTKVINSMRIVNSGMHNYSGIGNPKYPLYEKINFTPIKIQKDEYVLYSPKGFWEIAYKDYNVHHYSVGIIQPEVINQEIHLDTTTLKGAAGKKISVPKFNNSDTYYEYVITDNKFWGCPR